MNALFILIDQIISIYLYTLIAYVILTLLVQFEIANRYNRIIDFVLRAGLNSLWWNRFFLNFYPIDENIKKTLRKLIDMVRRRKHPVGKIG